MEAILSGIAYLGNPMYWLAFGIAVLGAAFVSLVPGVSATLVMAVSIPFIVFNIHDPLIGLVLLATLAGVNNTLDSIPAILVGLPGGSTQVTFLEGNQLAGRGLAAHTLGAVYAVSAIGGVIGALALLVIIPIIRPFILSFSFSEIAAMGFFGVAMVSALSSGAMLKGFAAALLGLLIGAIGSDPITGADRFTFGSLHLWEGLPLIAFIAGVFAVPELLDLTITRKPVAATGAVVSTREVFRGARDGLRRTPVAIRQSLFGVFLGMVPGIGSTVVDWLAYSFGISLHKGDRREFGKGSLDGVLFAESAQNSKEGGQAIPTLAFGIPGGQAWAFVIVAMLIYGLTPGPDMLSRHADITIMLVLSLALANLGITMLGLLFTGQLAKLTLIPYPVIGAAVIPIAFLAAYLDVRALAGIWIVTGAAALGMAMKAFAWPRPPLIIGFILGPIIEFNFQSALSIHGLAGLATRPLTIILTVLAVTIAVLFWRMNRRGVTPATVEGEATGTPTPPAGGADGPAPQDTAAEQPRGFRTRWSWDLLFPIALAGIALWFILTALDYPVRARSWPVSLGIGILVLTSLSLLVDLLRRGPKGPSEVLDIGLRSRGNPAALKNAAVLFSILALFLLAIFFIGLQYAAILFALLVPLTLASGKARMIGTPVAALVVAMFAFLLMDRVMAVIWPEPIFGQWILGLFAQ